jgi:hypothetical protein
MKTSNRLLFVSLLYLATFAHAADVEVKDPWARATVPAQKVTGAFMELKSTKGATLVGASSPVAGNVEVHEMKTQGDMMKMREIPRLKLPAGKAVTLAPGGYHIMLFELKQQLKAGESVPIKLVIERAGKRETVDVSAEVRATGGGHLH